MVRFPFEPWEKFFPFLTLWGSHTHEVGKGGGEDAKPTKGSHKVLWYTQKMWKVKKRRSPSIPHPWGGEVSIPHPFGGEEGGQNNRGGRQTFLPQSFSTVSNQSCQRSKNYLNLSMLNECFINISFQSILTSLVPA